MGTKDDATGTIYDFIIVGGGSAGCALANRLSADPSNTVLLLEAGRPDYIWDPFIHMPAAFSLPLGSRFYDWIYETEPEPNLGGRKVAHARGKVVGGSSSINGMIFQRGNPLDMEAWASLPGMETWGYSYSLPYFKKLESCLAGGDAWRGTDGPLKLERGPAEAELFDAFFRASESAGYSLTTDVNGYRQEGFAAFDRNIDHGRRLSAARAYLHPVLHRSNLQLLTRAESERIIVKHGVARGVEVRQRNLRGGSKFRVYSGRTIICCAGSINTPKLLQLSGIGPRSVLEAAGVPVIHDLPGVGENLQDHLEVYIQHSSLKPITQQPNLQKWRRPWIGLQWLLRRGPASTNHFEAGGFVRSRSDLTYPNVMIHFLPLAVRYDGTVAETPHGFQVHVGPMHATSRGSVHIEGADPSRKPSITFNYLGTEEDRVDWVEAVKVVRSILGQPAFKSISGGEISPGALIRTDEEILEWVRRDAETALHPCGTAQMGFTDLAVIDPLTMGVHGLEGLKVVDASVMPLITNGNIYAPTMMIAEKAADLILGNSPLPPEDPPFHSQAR